MYRLKVESRKYCCLPCAELKIGIPLAKVQNRFFNTSQIDSVVLECQKAIQWNKSIVSAFSLCEPLKRQMCSAIRVCCVGIGWGEA